MEIELLHVKVVVTLFDTDSIFTTDGEHFAVSVSAATMMGFGP